MTGYDAATVEVCARVAEERRAIFVVGPDVRTTVRFSPHEVAAAIRALPIAAPAPPLMPRVTMMVCDEDGSNEREATDIERAIARYQSDCGLDYEGAWEDAGGIAEVLEPIIAARLQVTADDVALIDGAEAAYDLARDAVVYPQRRAEYAIWAERYGRDLIALARRAAPAVDETAGDVAADVLARRAAAVNFAVACDPRG